QDNSSYNLVTMRGEGPERIYVNLDPAGIDPDPLHPTQFLPAVLVNQTFVGGMDGIPAQNIRTIDAEANLAWDRSAGPHRGRIYPAYTDATDPLPPLVPNDTSDTNILLRYSDDNGMHWSDPITVNDDGGYNSQFLPSIAVDQATGNIAVSWY